MGTATSRKEEHTLWKSNRAEHCMKPTFCCSTEDWTHDLHPELHALRFLIFILWQCLTKLVNCLGWSSNYESPATGSQIAGITSMHYHVKVEASFLKLLIVFRKGEPLLPNRLLKTFPVSSMTLPTLEFPRRSTGTRTAVNSNLKVSRIWDRGKMDIY